MRFEGTTALVTGGASGIGAATARLLAAEGARVAIGDINDEGARELAAELDGFGCKLDVTDTASVRAGGRLDRGEARSGRRARQQRRHRPVLLLRQLR